MKKLFLISVIILSSYGCRFDSDCRPGFKCLDTGLSSYCVRKNNKRNSSKNYNKYNNYSSQKQFIPSNMTVDEYIKLQEYQHKQQVKRRITNKFRGKKVNNSYSNKQISIPSNMTVDEYIKLQEYLHKQQVRRKITNKFNSH